MIQAAIAGALAGLLIGSAIGSAVKEASPKEVYRKLDAKAEEYLSEGNYVRRDNAMEDAGNIRQMMKGIRLAAEAIGIPEDVLRKAARDGA